MPATGYVPLQGQGYTRLLRLYPADDASSPLQCDLFEVSLEHMPGYEALSYAWGSPIQDQPVQCRTDGQPWTVSITKHLLTALRELRSDRGYRVLWVDQLCINQEDREERRLQVGQMDRVYHNATRTIIWLGQDTADTHLGLSLIASLSSAADTWLPKTSYFEDDVPSVENGFNYYVSLPPSRSPAWSALNTILDRSWFTRAWVMQEVSVSENLVIRCGPYEASWLSLSHGLKKYYTRTGPRHISSHGSRQVIEFEKTRRNYLAGSGNEPPQSAPLHQTLTSMRPMGATDPRDKVYAALNLADPRLRSAMDVDYTVSSQEVYCRAARVLILESEMFEDEPYFTVLSPTSVKGLPGMPSWVPDWSISQPQNRLNIWYAPFRASGNRQYQEITTDDLRTLAVRGCIVDRVLEVYSCSAPAQSDVTTKSSSFLEWFEVIRLMEHYPSTCPGEGEKTIHAFARTITADCLISPSFQGDMEVFANWHASLKPATEPRASNEPPSPTNEADVANFQGLCGPAGGRRLVKSCRELLGIAPEDTRPGDVVCILYGGNVPYILRRVDDYYLYVGECYLHGVMYGEALALDGIEDRDFYIH